MSPPGVPPAASIPFWTSANYYLTKYARPAFLRRRSRADLARSFTKVPFQLEICLDTCRKRELTAGGEREERREGDRTRTARRRRDRESKRERESERGRERARNSFGQYHARRISEKFLLSKQGQLYRVDITLYLPKLNCNN